MSEFHPGVLADQARRRQEVEAITPEQQQEALARSVDELLARDVFGAEEADVLEQAHKLVNDALGRG